MKLLGMDKKGNDLLVVADNAKIVYNCECGEHHELNTTCERCKSVVKAVVICINVEYIERGTEDDGTFCTSN